MLSYCLKCKKNKEQKPKGCKDKKQKTNGFIKLCSLWY